MNNYWITKHLNISENSDTNLCKYFDHTKKSEKGHPLQKEQDTGCALRDTPESTLNSNSEYFPLQYKANLYFCNKRKEEENLLGLTVLIIIAVQITLYKKHTKNTLLLKYRAV